MTIKSTTADAVARAAQPRHRGPASDLDDLDDLDDRERESYRE